MGKFLEFVWTDWELMVLYGGMKLMTSNGIDRAVITRNTEGATRPGRPPAHSPRSILEGILWEITEAARGGSFAEMFFSLSDLPQMAAILAKNRHI